MDTSENQIKAIHIVPLSYKTLSKAYAVLRESFPMDRRWYLDILVSLNPWKAIGIPRLGGCDMLQYWVAMEKHQVVGITGVYTTRLTPERVAWIGWTAVKPLFRRQGFGRQLVEHVAAFAQTAGLDVLAAYTSETHRGAIHVYQALGFGLERGRGHFMVFKRKLGQNCGRSATS